MKKLENSNILCNMELADVLIVDGKFLLLLLSDLPERNYQEIDRFISRIICSSFSSKMIDNVFDEINQRKQTK